MEDEDKRVVIVGRNFFQMIVSIYEFIKKDSPQNAEKFRDGIQDKMEMVESHPRAFPLILSEQKEDELIEYRYIHYMKTFKIIYKLPKNLLIFLGILHDKQSDEAIKELQKKDFE